MGCLLWGPRVESMRVTEVRWIGESGNQLMVVTRLLERPEAVQAPNMRDYVAG